MSSLEQLGFTKEEIEQKVVEKIAADMLNEYVYDSETGADEARDSHLAQKFHDIVRKHVDRQLNKLAEEYIVPHVREIIESVCLQKTNEWGEKVGNPQTFTEYLVGSAQNYLSQPVDFEGKPVERSSYRTNEQTRLVHLVHKHLHYGIESAMKNAVDVVKAQIGESLQETVKIQLGKIAGSLKVSLTTK